MLAELHPCHPYATPMRVRAARLITIGAAVVVALVAWFVAGERAGIALDVRSGDATQHVGPIAVVLATLLGGIVAWALAALLERVTSRPRMLWTAVMVAALLLSIAGPLSLGIGGATQGALIAMHQLVGGTLIAGMGPTIRRR